MSASSSDQALGAYLRRLREEAGLELPVLARRLSLSTAQLLELESGGRSLFYSPAIRQLAVRKTLQHLGGDLTRLVTSQEPSALPPATGQTLPSEPPLHRPLGTPEASAASATRVGAGSTTPKASRRRWVMPGGLALSALFFAGAVAVGHWERSPPLSQAGTAPFLVPPEAGRAAPALPPAAAETLAASPVTREVPAQPASAEARAEAGEPPCAPSPAPSVTPPQASKPGDMVYVVSRASLDLCVIDGQGRPQQFRLEAGEGRSFYGPPPWQLHSSQLRQAQLYFQGWKVRLPAQVADRVELVELR